MPWTRYKKYYIMGEFGYEALAAVDDDLQEQKRPDYYTSLELDNSLITLEEIEEVVRSPITQKYYRYFLLNEDESINEEITDYIFNGITFDKNNESGQTKSLSIQIHNQLIEKISYQNCGSQIIKPVKTSGYRWLPNANESILFGYNKIKILSYMQLKDRIYEKSEGIFYMADPQLSDGAQGHSVTVQLHDKFAMLDGTLQGEDDIDYEIPWGTPIEEAAKSLLKLPRDNRGTPLDDKDMFFPLQYKNALTAYTIKKTGENAVGELIKELALSISCDAQYNNEGHLEIKNSLEDLDYHNRSIAWFYQDSDFGEPSIQINRSSIKNKVTVVGANINGHLVKGVAENTNPNSNYNINGIYGVKSIKITDDLLSTNTLCEDRARYELKKYAQNYATLTFTSIYIPHLEPGDLINWSYPTWGIYDEIFLVTSLNQSESGTMTVTATNVRELSI